jgi:hypothetical protein
MIEVLWETRGDCGVVVILEFQQRAHRYSLVDVELRWIPWRLCDSTVRLFFRPIDDMGNAC